MQIQSAPDLATRSHTGSDLFRPKDEVNDSFQPQPVTKVRCICDSKLLNDNMIQVL